MRRFLLLVLVTAGWTTGCAVDRSRGDDTPTPEMARLHRMVGEWAGEAKILSMPGPMAEMAEDAGAAAGGGTTRFTLGGRYLVSEGWHTMGPEFRSNYVEYVTWDASVGKYRAWFFSDQGEHGEATWTLEGNSITMAMKGMNAEGKATTGQGRMTFADDDTVNWTWSETSVDGTMSLGGVSRRQ